MKKLRHYAQTSRLMDIRIKLGDEMFKFNLYEEIIIDENIINDEIKSQPPISSFLGTLFTKIDRIKEDREAERDKIYYSLFSEFKNKVGDSGRYHSDDMAKALTLSSKKFQVSQKKYLQAKENSGLIKTCLQAFEQRTYLIQTLSANIRKSD